jgi:two-component system, LuxR family, response regulator FixJ
MGDLDLQAHLLENAVDLPFIAVTGHSDVSSVLRVFKSGAADFIEKPIDGKLFIAAIERAAVARFAVKAQLEAATMAQERISGLRHASVMCCAILSKAAPTRSSFTN